MDEIFNEYLDLIFPQAREKLRNVWSLYLFEYYLKKHEISVKQIDDQTLKEFENYLLSLTEDKILLNEAVATVKGFISYLKKKEEKDG